MSAPTQLTHEEVRAIADLAKLALSDEEVAMYAEQLSEILGFFTMLQEVDTSAVQPTDSTIPHRNVLREDVAKEALDPKTAIANAPDAEANQFKVRAVLSGE